MALPPDAAVEFACNGYYVARGLLEPKYLDTFLKHLDAICRAQLQHHHVAACDGEALEVLHDNLAALHRHDQRLYLATLVAVAKLKSLYDIFMVSDVDAACRRLGVVMPLMHTLPVFHMWSSRLRIDQGYFGFGAHQDWSGLQTSINALTVWVPFHDIDRTRFPLEIAPRTHRAGVCPGTVDNNEYTIDAEYRRDESFIPVEVEKGDVVFMSPFTIHRTGMAGSGQLRIAASWRYEDALEPNFIARRYPLAQTKVVRHEPFSPGFPDTEQMAVVLERIRASADSRA